MDKRTSQNKILIAIFISLFTLTAFLQATGSPIKFEDLEAESEFILVVDKSGSMSGDAIRDARTALKEFVKDVRSTDAVAILEFSDNMHFSQRMTRNRSALYAAADRLSAGGGTKLYDAMGKALMEIRSSRKRSVIVFMTDGQDGGSALNAGNLANMCPSQGVFVYGIGLGNVDQSALKEIASATGGDYEYTGGSKNLEDLYIRVLQSYYRKTGQVLVERSQLVIRALPPGQVVFLNEKRLGETPLLVSGLKEGNYNLRVEFPKGDWNRDFFLPAGKRAYADARESDLPKNLAIMSVPHSAMVFIDEQFVGYTSPYLKRHTTTEKGFIFKREVKKADYSRELIVEAVPKGRHNLRIVALPDQDFQDFFKPLEYRFYMGDKNQVINADCRTGEVDIQETDTELKPGGRAPVDPFDELDDDFGDDEFDF